MGDVVSLVERAAESIEKEDAEKLARKVQKGEFDLNDLLGQLRQIKKMGGLEGLMGMLPGVQQLKSKMAQANIDPHLIKRQEAVILSMTAKERVNPKLIHASRKKRIAAGAGVQVQDVNKLLKQHVQMVDMMKKVGKLGKKGLLRGGFPGLMPR
jgi:signal recognition particle subunit SRP54